MERRGRMTGVAAAPPSPSKSCSSPLLFLLVLSALGPLVTTLEVPLDLPQPPTITAQSPKNHIVDPRESIVIQCEAKGKPHPRFSWTRNGTHFDVDQEPKVTMKQNSGTLVLDILGEKAEMYEGMYQCTARNEHGTALSHNMVVRQSRSPLWSKETIEPRVVLEGVPLVLPCRPPGGLPTPSVSWMDNSFNKLPESRRVSQGLNGDLYFSNVLKEDTRKDYICYARFTHTQTIQQKQPIPVTVLNQVDAINETMADLYNETDLFSDTPAGDRVPIFLVPSGASSTQLVLRGEVLKLECIAEGLPTPEVEWMKVGAELPEKRHSFPQHKKQLHIVNVSEADAGEYRCSAENQMGSVQHHIHVTVRAAPYWISGPPPNLVLAPKETGVLTCRASGIPKPNIAWSMNGIPVENSLDDPSRRVEDDTVIFSEAVPGTSAVYQCNVSNEYGYLLANAFVNVLSEPPRVLTQANKVYRVIRHHRALLDCSVFGSPIPKITWFKDGSSGTLESEPYLIHENGTLELHVALAENSGKYTCVARNTLGTQENHVSLEVKEPTRIMRQPEYKTVQRGMPAVFECKVTHDPTLTPIMTWLKDDDELPDDERFIVDSDSLTIAEVGEDDEGIYTCVMNTTLDHDSARAELSVVESEPTPAVVYERPDPPTDLELTDKEETSVQLTWTPGDDNNMPIDNFLIQYQESLHDPHGHWHNQTEVPGTRTTAHLQLSPYAHYTFRVLALNGVGFSEPSRPSGMFKTAPAAPHENPSNVHGHGTKHDNLVISWEPLEGIQANGPQLEYIVTWRQKGVDADWTSVTVANVSKFEVSGTPTFSRYEFKVQARNKYGLAPAPATAHGHSGEDLPVTAPGNTQVQVVNSTLAEVHWDPVSPESIRGHLKGYKVYYWKEHSLHKHNPHHVEKQILTFSGYHNHGMLPGLHPSSTYSVNVRVYNGKGEGPPSPTRQFETPEGVPGPPSFLTASDPGPDSLTLEWAPPREPNGPLVGYTLTYRPVNSSNERGPFKELSLAPNETSVRLPHLKYSTRYQFFLSAKTATGEGPAIPQEGGTILDEGIIQAPHPIAPSPTRFPHHKGEPSVPSFSNVSCLPGEEGLVFKWDYLGPERTMYLEYVMKNSGGEEQGEDKAVVWQREYVNNTQSAVLRGLKESAVYRVRLVAEGPGDQTPHHSEELSVTGPATTTREVDIATQGWFIGLMCAIALLILILLIICFIQRNKGGKYPVKEKEDAHTDPEFQPMKDDDCTFGEYSDSEDHKPLKGSRTPSSGRTVKRGDSDDSLVDYSEAGDVQFNEDGSFIGQYSGKSGGRDAGPGDGAPESSEAPSPITTAMNSLNSFV